MRIILSARRFDECFKSESVDIFSCIFAAIREFVCGVGKSANNFFGNSNFCGTGEKFNPEEKKHLRQIFSYIESAVLTLIAVSLIFL